MIGWRIEPAPDDAGMPPLVAKLLADVLTKVAQVTFRSARHDRSAARGGSVTSDDLVTELPAGFLDSLRGRSVIQVSTQSAESAALLFDDPSYPWWLGAQAALLSPPGTSNPAMRREDWDPLLADDWISAATDLAAANLIGVVRAGVDGDVAGLWSRDRAFADALLCLIRANAEAAGLGWLEVAEADF